VIFSSTEENITLNEVKGLFKAINIILSIAKDLSKPRKYHPERSEVSCNICENQDSSLRSE
jgi:hypothetical protein